MTFLEAIAAIGNDDNADLLRGVAETFVGLIETAGPSEWDYDSSYFNHVPPYTPYAPSIPHPDIPKVPEAKAGAGNAGGVMGNASEAGKDSYVYEPALTTKMRDQREETIRFWDDNKDTFPKLVSKPPQNIKNIMDQTNSGIPTGDSYQPYAALPNAYVDANKTLAFSYGPNHAYGYPSYTVGGAKAGGGGGE